jgi:hypothetical protein
VYAVVDSDGTAAPFAEPVVVDAARRKIAEGLLGRLKETWRFGRRTLRCEGGESVDRTVDGELVWDEQGVRSVD